MVFCASLVPWLWAIHAALTSCNFPKILCTMWGVKGRSKAKSSAIKIPPSKKPITGEVNIGTTTFGISPVSHFSTDQSPPADATAEPHKPPMSA